MKRKYLAFDIEIAKPIPDGCTDWKALRPLGISCAATWASDEPEPRLWGGDAQLTVRAAFDLVGYLALMRAKGYTILTHNGTSFDWDILAEESHLFEDCRNMAMNHVDTCFLAHCLLGYPVGLDACAKGFGIPGKPEGMDGSKAPELWADGEYQTVLDYCAQDTRITLEVAQAIERIGKLQWYSRRGRLNWVKVDRLLTVRQSMELPLPDTAWMSDPLPRSKFMEWMQREPV